MLFVDKKYHIDKTVDISKYKWNQIMNKVVLWQVRRILHD